MNSALTRSKHDIWCEQVERKANELIGHRMINWKEVEFNWAERYLDDDPEMTVVYALISAAQDQINKSIKIMLENDGK